MNTPSPLSIPKSKSWLMFDDIAPRYDFLNHLLSFGLDIRWRRLLGRFLTQRSTQKVLDIATGTADVLLNLFKINPNVCEGYGIDLAEKMMDIGRIKIVRQGLESRITLKRADAHSIPFNDNMFDCATIAFGIRNMDDPGQVLKEIYRVLAAGGRALILEFSLPQNKAFRALHLFYLRHFVPLIGAVLTGHYKAYRYLNQTIETFPYGNDFCAMMQHAGFQSVISHPLLFGVATIYQGDRT